MKNLAVNIVLLISLSACSAAPKTDPNDPCGSSFNEKYNFGARWSLSSTGQLGDAIMQHNAQMARCRERIAAQKSGKPTPNYTDCQIIGNQMYCTDSKGVQTTCQQFGNQIMCDSQ